MITQFKKRRFQKLIHDGISIEEIRELPLFNDESLTLTEFNTLARGDKTFTPKEEPYIQKPVEYFKEAIQVKNPYPSISFRCPKKLKERWIRFIDSQTAGRYNKQKQAPFLIEMLTDYLDKHSVPEDDE
ncbi:hypothetical protein M0R19_01950 [Candidatus Pacearchaeota archaeon]|nr:hypothetical protein [Candidatus Pacearchaeota archaeon]